MSAPGGSWDAQLSAAYEHAQRATKAELARDYSSAFELYVRSGQLFLHLLSTHPSRAPDGTRDRLKQMANKVTARAERIKTTHNVRRVERHVLSTDQQASILAASSKINARHFPAWSEQTLSCQPAPELSPVQIGNKAQYKRSSQIVGADAGWGRRLRGDEIVQDIVTDCSFVAALEAAAEHDFLFGTSLATSSLYPQDPSGLPSPSPSGRYRVRLHINGAARCVEIDDHLPYYPPECGERIMGASCRKGHTVWPALLEKAYLTLMGGYDFGGSNASIDAHALTAWLPEHVFLRHAGFQREKSWSRFHAAWTQGKCFATVGTPSKTQAGLVPSHNYAILGVQGSGSQRHVTLMNPWRHAEGKHPSIALDTKERDVVQSLQRLKVADGATFTVTWDDLCTYFDSLFLNWDPSMFAHTLSVHSCWRAPTPQSGIKVDQADPRFRLVMSPTAAAGGEGEEVWMLLTRHITSTRDRPDAECSGQDAEYIAVHVFEDDTSRGSGQSSQPLGQARQVGAYVDGTHCLVRFKPSSSRNADVAERSFTVVASRRTSQAVETRYTLSVYSHHAVSLSQVRTHLAFRESLSGAWTSRTAGGNATLPTFMSNPQYTLTIPGADEVQVNLTLECSDRRVPVQLLLAYPGPASGGRVTSLTQGDVVLSSGMYHHGLALCNTSNSGRNGLRPGTYTLIASTFEAATTADFILSIESTHPVQLKAIPQEGAGMFHRRITASWTQSNAKGSRGNRAYFDNPSWRIVVPPPAMAALVARIKANATDAVRPYVNSALYDEKEVANSGAYTDLPCGAVLDTMLKPGSYTLLASTYKPDVHAAFSIDLYTTVRCDVTPH
jgi:calpain-7